MTEPTHWRGIFTALLHRSCRLQHVPQDKTTVALLSRIAVGAACNSFFASA